MLCIQAMSRAVLSQTKFDFPAFAYQLAQAGSRGLQV
jgi:hypothetical protein